MGERMVPLQSADTARQVEDMQSTHWVLSNAQKKLAEISTKVASVVETDTTSRDFGRIKYVPLAEEMAHKQNRSHDQNRDHLTGWLHQVFSETPMSDEDIEANDLRDQYALDQSVANGFYYMARADEYDERQATKIANDYLITQGDIDVLLDRFDDIYNDVRDQKEPSDTSSLDAVTLIFKAIRMGRATRHPDEYPGL